MAESATPIDFRLWLALELSLIALGLPAAEVRGYAIPKLNVYAELTRKLKMQDALLQSAAVWAPDKVQEQMESGERGLGSVESETPRSMEEWERMTGIKV